MASRWWLTSTSLSIIGCLTNPTFRLINRLATRFATVLALLRERCPPNPTRMACTHLLRQPFHHQWPTFPTRDMGNWHFFQPRETAIAILCSLLAKREMLPTH